MYSNLFKYFPDALMMVSFVGEVGKKKYEHDWSPDDGDTDLYLDAMLRHTLKHSKQIFDEEMTELAGFPVPHLFLIAWNALAALQCAIENGSSEED